jgi:biopolymer transport protein ExbD
VKIRFNCAGCGRLLMADDRHAGAKLKCPKCGRVTVAPEAAEAQPAAAGTPATAKQGRAVPPEESPPIRFLSKRSSDDKMDMTPMVDITFLLLIFFMVTAAYSLQRSIEVPPPDQQQSATQARTLEEIEQDDDYVIVEIHADNRIFVNDKFAPSEHELLVRLREEREGLPGSDSRGPSSLLVLADGDCRHETVVKALDAGNAVGMVNVRLATADETAF